MKPKEGLGTTWHFPHCWGPPELIFKTTVQAFGNNKTELPWGKLSRTLREAIEVTRRLGIRYIWIDSLCVLQVDEDDWNREAANMGNINKNAYLTLAATASSGGMGGLHVENLELATLKARRSRLHFSLEVLESGDSFVHRGWAYQERLLARQIVHFTSEEMVWECKPQQTRECSSPSGLQEGRSEFESLLEGGRKSWWSWQMLLTRYTTLQLSKEEDRLPAISGIASQLFDPSDYLAGIRRRWILKDLCWERYSTCGSIRTSRQAGAPTWSWASINCPISWPESRNNATTRDNLS
ncbi:heterokaryon incompatibility protein-domain-containing protein [Leptodontidium sp. MPI-SDFR-AT-0119]|nr:heterokaryon incompatibility protein-domain-containing protein [Leptodontidium sp. MPI-SDFR-AT-0119]